MIFDHTSEAYKKKYEALSAAGKHNGAYYYSIEIVNNIIPNVVTDRSWITVNSRGHGANHSIVFIHNNLHPENYEWLKSFNDVVLVCGVPETMDKVKRFGHPIYLPLSIDVDYVSGFKAEHQSGTAFVGRPAKRRMPGVKLPQNIECIEGIDRADALAKMAQYKNIYAVGRSAIEARCLGCNILTYDPRYPDASIWRVIDNKDAAGMLQSILDEIDGRNADSASDAPSMAWLKADMIEYAKEHGVFVDKRDNKAMILNKIKRC